MKILIIGSSGFVGRYVSESLSDEHEVVNAIRDKKASGKNTVFINLESPESIVIALNKTEPDGVINCAGVVENSERAKLNEIFTGNLLQAIVDSRKKLSRIVILGSAAEYGVVRPEDLPVDEDTPLNPVSDYGDAKVRETTTALEYRRDHNLPVVVARIFNPIGPGMNERQLIPSLIKQINIFKQEKTDFIEVSRLDAERDYIDVRDVGRAIAAIVEGHPKEHIYNLGSGKSTSNLELVETMLRELKFDSRPKLKEFSVEKEPLYAIKADITRIKDEFDWDVKYDLSETIRHILDVQN